MYVFSPPRVWPYSYCFFFCFFYYYLKDERAPHLRIISSCFQRQNSIYTITKGNLHPILPLIKYAMLNISYKKYISLPSIAYLVSNEKTYLVGVFSNGKITCRLFQSIIIPVFTNTVRLMSFFFFPGNTHIYIKRGACMEYIYAASYHDEY